MNQVVSKQDHDEVRKRAHKLKGTAANLSAEPLRRACEKLEFAAASQEIDRFPVLLEALTHAAQAFKSAGNALLQDEIKK
jgi:HPt (histidine-containing phosphotransfer) domain-containing protein